MAPASASASTSAPSAEAAAPVPARNDLRAALQLAVTKICVEEDDDAASSIGGGGGAATTTTTTTATARTSPSAVLALSELLYLYVTTCLARDLEAFCRHANRRTISEADVLLVARKHPRIARRLQEFCRRSFGGNNKNAGERGEGGAAVPSACGAATATLRRQRGRRPSSSHRLDFDDDDSSSTDSSRSTGGIGATGGAQARAALLPSKPNPSPPSQGESTDDSGVFEVPRPPLRNNNGSSFARSSLRATAAGSRPGRPTKRLRLPPPAGLEEGDDSDTGGDSEDDDNDEEPHGALAKRARAAAGGGSMAVTVAATARGARAKPTTLPPQKQQQHMPPPHPPLSSVRELLETLSQDST